MGLKESAHIEMKFTFPKQEKLKSKKKIEELFKRGSSFYLSPFQVKLLEIKSEDPTQLLIAVPKKLHKLAVTRNRIKRLIRETYRLNKQEIFTTSSKRYSIAILYLSKDIPTFDVVNSKLSKLLYRLPFENKGILIKKGNRQ
jgi:ribonuclease P protein component